MSIQPKNRIPDGICHELDRNLQYNYEVFFSSKDEMGIVGYNSDDYIPFSFCPFCGRKITTEFVKGRGLLWRYETVDVTEDSEV